MSINQLIAQGININPVGSYFKAKSDRQAFEGNRLMQMMRQQQMERNDQLFPGQLEAQGLTNQLAQYKLDNPQLLKGELPSSVREWEYFNGLQDDAMKRQYLTMKRAGKIQDFGGYVAPIDPLTGQPGRQTPKTLAPKDDPAHQRLVKEMQEEVKINAEKDKERPKVTASFRGLQRQTATVNSSIDRAMGLINRWSTGAGAWFDFIPNSDSGKLKNMLNTIKANVGFDKLQNMRDNSKTGGALGQVSELENKLLQAVNGALDPTQRDQLEQNLANIKVLYQEVLEEKRQQLKEHYGVDIPSNAQPQQQPQANNPSIDNLVNKYAN